MRFSGVAGRLLHSWARVRPAVLLVLAAHVSGAGAQSPPRTTGQSKPWADLVARLSEPGGYFDTDNLISNEPSYLHVLGGLRALGVTGGAYIGVGPDQNFSYIAEIRPAVAYLIDIRRDNLLEHLLFKAIFTLATDRGEYLALLLGRPAHPPDGTSGISLDSLLASFDRVPPPDAKAARALAAMVQIQAGKFGIPLSPQDMATLDRFHRAFMDAGLELQFVSFGRRPQSYYPTYRQLLSERDRNGRQASYLATEERWRVVRAMQLEDRIVPVVGNLAGPVALKAVAENIRRRGLSVSAFYTSNVEFYLMGDGTFPRFLDNLRALPRKDRSVLIRSYFSSGFRPRHPHAVPGYPTTQVLQTIDALLGAVDRGLIGNYADLVTRNVLEPPAQR